MIEALGRTLLKNQEPEAGDGMIGWALRWVLLWCRVTLVCVAVIGGDEWLPSDSATKPEIVLRAATPVEPRADPAVNTLVYPANRAGHVIIDAVVNGAPMRMLVDTGASFVTLTPADARAAGITPGELVFNRRASTANGFVRMAIVTLRESASASSRSTTSTPPCSKT